LMAEESGLARKVTAEAISSGRISRSMSDVGRFSAMNRVSASAGVASGKRSARNFWTPSVRVEPGRTGLTVTAGPLVRSARVREAPRDRELHGLGGAVAGHLGRGAEARLAGDEEDPPPAPLQHARQVVPAEAHAAEDVDLEEALPGLVRLVEEADGLVDSQV